VHGLLRGVIHRSDGTTRTFDAMRTLRVKSMNGVTPGAATRSAAGVGGAGAGSCQILNLVLAPLDLNCSVCRCIWTRSC
jgi:hypothetical protein